MRTFGSLFPPQKKVAIHNLKFGVRYLKFRVNQSKFQGSSSKFWVSSLNQEYLCKYVNSLLLEALDASCPTIWHHLLEGIQSWRTWCWLSHVCYTLVAHSCWWYYLILSMHLCHLLLGNKETTWLAELTWNSTYQLKISSWGCRKKMITGIRWEILTFIWKGSLCESEYLRSWYLHLQQPLIENEKSKKDKRETPFNHVICDVIA